MCPFLSTYPILAFFSLFSSSPFFLAFFLLSFAHSYFSFIFDNLLDTDIVTSVTFHPTDNNLFLSGSLDNKLILWNIEQKSVVYIVDTHEFITTVAFTLNGKLAIAGLHSGMCTFYDVEVI